MVDERQAVREAGAVAADFVDFRAAGERTEGEFHCADCTYGIAVRGPLPVCPMCGGTSWEQSWWRPRRDRI